MRPFTPTTGGLRAPRHRLTVPRAAMAMLLMAAALLAVGQDAERTATGTLALNETVATTVTSDTVEMDFVNRVAVFEGNVVAIDPKMTLNAKRMIVAFSADDQLTRIEAVGDVVIRESNTDRRATAGHAVYSVAEGTVVLTDNPAVAVGESKATKGERIVYFRDSQRFRFEGGRPTIELRNQADGDTGLQGLLSPTKEATP